MPPSPPQGAVRLNAEALRAMAQRRSGEARALLGQALEIDPGHLPAWINLAAARRMEGDLAGALTALDDALKIAPLDFRALLMRASLLEALGKPRHAANAYNHALAVMPPLDRLDAATRRATEHGLAFHARHVQEMEAFLRHDGQAERLSGHSAEVRRMSHFVDHMLGKRRRFRSEPTSFFYPGLPSIEIHDRALFPWLPEVEAATPAIRDELIAVLDDEVASSDLEPYMTRGEDEPLEQWTELNKSLRWSAYHFALYGKAYEAHRQRCPITARLLDSVPFPSIPNRSPASLFSILEPKTHIPPHHGVANFRLLCHLPLILPPDCRFRVGNEIRPWRMGEGFVFDDSIEHEAWNDSDQRRVVLIFDIWNPGLSAAEQDFITRTLTALDRFNAEE